MSDFLDFVFPFGESERARDFHFSDFRVENQFSNNPNDECALAVPALGRSGRQFQMCFNLRSVERTKYDRRRPFSIRQTAVYHCFDLETGRTVWIFVKGNDLIRQRIRNTQYKDAKTENKGKDSVETLVAAFGISLDVHTILCNWARENWRWYISFLEETFQDRTRRSLHASVDNENRPEPEIFAAPARSCTEPPAIKRQRTGSSLSRPMFRNLKRSLSLKSSSAPAVRASGCVQPQPAPAPGTINPSEDKGFSFDQLQFVQSLEEKVIETLLVLKTNMDVLGELKDCYMRFQESESWPDELKSRTNDRLIQFESRISHTISGLSMEKSRLETLANQISNRKTLVSM